MHIFVTALLLFHFPLSIVGQVLVQSTAPWEPATPETHLPEANLKAVNLSQSFGNTGNPQIVHTPDAVGIVYQDSVVGNGDIFYLQSTDDGVTFQPPENISYSPDASRNPVLAIADNRTCIAWEENNGRLLARGRSDNRDAFGPVVQISSAASLASEVKVLIRDGKFYAFFAQVEQGIRQIFVNASEDGGRTWGKEPAKAIATQGNVTRLSAAINEAGEIVLLWLEDSGNRVKLNIATNLQGIGFSTPQTLSFPPGGPASDIQLASRGSSILVGWTQTRKAKSRVHFAVSTTANRIFLPVNVNISIGAVSPTVALTDTTAYIAWVSTLEKRTLVSASTTGGEGDFQQPTPISTISDTTTSVAAAASQMTLFIGTRREIPEVGKRSRFEIVTAVSTDSAQHFTIFPALTGPGKKLAQAPLLVLSNAGELLVVWVDTAAQGNNQVFFGRIKP